MKKTQAGMVFAVFILMVTIMMVIIREAFRNYLADFFR